jgi:hypothetical protein
MPRKAKYIDVKSLLEAVNESKGDAEIKERATAFLTTDLGSLRTESEIRRAWGGLATVISLVAPLHPAYRHTCNVLLKALNSYSGKNDSLSESLETVRREVAKAWAKVILITKREFPPEVYEKVKFVLDSVENDLKDKRQ